LVTKYLLLIFSELNGRIEKFMVDVI